MLLRRQMDAIRKELGEADDDIVAEYRAKLADKQLPDAVRARGRQGARPARAHGQAESRAGVGPQLARRGRRAAVGRVLPRSTPTSTPRVRCSTPITKASPT